MFRVAPYSRVLSEVGFFCTYEMVKTEKITQNISLSSNLQGEVFVLYIDVHLHTIVNHLSSYQKEALEHMTI